MILNATVAKKFTANKTPKSTLVHLKFSSYLTLPPVSFWIMPKQTNKMVFIVVIFNVLCVGFSSNLRYLLLRCLMHTASGSIYSWCGYQQGTGGPGSLVLCSLWTAFSSENLTRKLPLPRGVAADGACVCGAMGM